MDDSVDASNELRDYNSVINASANDPLDKVASVLQLAEQPEFDATSKENVSEGSSDMTKKRSRKKIKKKVDVIKEIQCTCMRQTEMNMKITDQVNDNLGASDNTSRVVNNESEKNLPAKDVPVLKLAEHPELDDGLMENASEGTLGTEKKRKRKKEKKKVNVLNEVQIMDPMLLNAGTMDNLTEIIDQRDGTLEASRDVRDYNAVTKNFEMNLLHKDATALPLTEISNIDATSTANPSGVNTDTKRIKRRNRKKVNAKNDFQSMDQEMTEHLAGTNDRMDESAQAPEQVRDCNVVNNESEKNLIYVVNNEVQNMDQMLLNAGTMENLTAIIDQRDGTLEASGDVKDYNAVAENLEMNFLHKDASGFPLTEHSNTDAASTANPSGVNTVTKKIKRRNRNKVNAKNEIQSMDQEMTKHLTETNAQMDESARAPERVRDCNVVNNESEKNLIYAVNNEVQNMDQMLLNAGTMENLTAIIDQKDGTLEASGDVKDYNAVAENLEMNFLHKDASGFPLTEHSNTDAASTANPSGVNTVTKKIKRRSRKKVNAKNEIQSMDQEMTEHLTEANAQMDESAQAPERVRDCNVVNNESEKNLIYVVNNEVQNMDQMLLNAGTMENLTAIIDQKDGTLEASGDVKDYNAVAENLEMNFLHKDASGFPLTEHSNTDAASTANPSGVNTVTKKIKRRNRKKVNAKNEIQSMDQEMTEHLTETNAQMDESAQAPEQVRDCNVVKNESEKNLIYVVNNEVQNMDQMLLNAGTMENLTAIINQRDGTLEASGGVRDYNTVAKNFEMNLIHKDATGLPLTEHSKFDAASTANSSGVNTDTKKIKRQKRKKVNAKNEIQSMNQEMTEHLAETNDRMDLYAQAPEQVRDCNVVINESEKHLINKDAIVLPLSEHSKLEAGSTDSVLEHNIETNKRKRRKKNTKVMVMNEFQSMGGMEMNKGTAENLAEIKYQLDDHVEPADKLRNFVCSIVNNESENKFPDTDASLPLVAEHSRLEAWSIKNASEENMDKKVNVSNEVLTMDKGETTTMTTESLAQIMACRKRKRSNKKNKKKAKSEIESMNPADAMYKILLPAESMNPADAMYKILLPAKNLVAGTDKLVNVVNEANNDIFTDRRKYATEDRGILSPSNVEITKPIASPDEKEDKYSSERLGEHPKIELGVPIRRKLLVLDVNGLLADIVKPAPKHCRGDVHILQRAIFKRPFCSDFLNFCFQNFDVGIWSSRSKVIIDRVVDYLLGYRKDKLLFCWNMSHATQTGRRTLENIHKPLVLKELSKIWENNLSNSRWKKGDYDESNTLLLDDSPYKALLNPPHTAIFPSSFHYGDRCDNSLGPGGDLRVYLERLLACDNVQKYVEQNPFGQGAINEKNPSWEFYSGILRAMTNRFNNNRSSSLPTSSQGLTAPLAN